MPSRLTDFTKQPECRMIHLVVDLTIEISWKQDGSTTISQLKPQT